MERETVGSVYGMVEVVGREAPGKNQVFLTRFVLFEIRNYFLLYDCLFDLYCCTVAPKQSSREDGGNIARRFANSCGTQNILLLIVDYLLPMP